MQKAFGNMFMIHAINKTKNLTSSFRSMSSQAPLVNLTTEKDGISIMNLQRPPINKMNLQMLQEIDQHLDDVEKSKCRGLIITSAYNSVFSAGMDIMEFYKPDLKRAETFWRTLQDVFYKLFGSGFITAAAINGHAPAGGCLVSMSTEYRVMVEGKYTIGLNETALGFAAPRWFMDTFCHTIPVRKAEYALTASKLFTVEEAFKVGLVDEIATNKEDAIDKCKNFIRRFDEIPYSTRAMTKQRIREGVLTRFQKRRETDVQEFLSYLKHPEIKRHIEAYIEGFNKQNSN